MRLTRQTEIAISILISCARRQTVIDTELAAWEARTTRDHAAQVVKAMVRAGWIETRRGQQPISRSDSMDVSLGSVLSEVTTVVHNLLDCYPIADLAEICPGEEGRLKTTRNSVRPSGERRMSEEMCC